MTAAIYDAAYFAGWRLGAAAPPAPQNRSRSLGLDNARPGDNIHRMESTGRSRNMTVGEALNNPNTVLGNAALRQRKRQEQMKDWTPAQREAFWQQVAKSTR